MKYLLIPAAPFFIFLFLTVSLAYAKTPTPSPTPTASPQAMELNTFELFWPLVAGKTVDNPLFFLKNLKEKVRGILIFGNPQKVDYAVLISTKRLLEGEKLLGEEKLEAAKKSLGLAEGELEQAENYFAKSKESNENYGNVGPQIVTRLTNMEKLVTWLIFKDEKNKELLESLLGRITSLKAKL